jgi:site-specific DNA recombinase
MTELRKGIGRLVRAAGDRDDGPLADELRKLNDEYTDVEAQVQQIEAQLEQQEDVPTERDVADALRTVKPLWAELFPAEKERVVRLLVETVSIRVNGGAKLWRMWGGGIL